MVAIAATTASAFSTLIMCRAGEDRKMDPSHQGNQEMVGTTGFEPATSRTPSVRATRLRYVPTGAQTAMCAMPILQGLKPQEIWLRNVAAKAATHKTQCANRGSFCSNKAITAVRAASRKCGGCRANRAAFCGSTNAPSLPAHGSRPRSPPSFLHARAETGALPRW